MKSWIWRPAGFERSSRTVSIPHVAAERICTETSAGQLTLTKVGRNAAVAEADAAGVAVGTTARPG